MQETMQNTIKVTTEKEKEKKSFEEKNRKTGIRSFNFHYFYLLFCFLVSQE